jgi:hypothetical protein
MAVRSYFIIVATLAVLTFFSSWINGKPETMTGVSITIRQAEKSDLEAVSTIALASLPLDPQWDYRFPHAAAFPEDHQKFTRIRYSEYFENQERGGCLIMIAELPLIENPTISKAISFAIWQLPGSHLGPPEGDGKSSELNYAASNLL